MTEIISKHSIQNLFLWATRSWYCFAETRLYGRKGFNGCSFEVIKSSQFSRCYCVQPITLFLASENNFLLYGTKIFIVWRAIQLEFLTYRTKYLHA